VTGLLAILSVLLMRILAPNTSDTGDVSTSPSVWRVLCTPGVAACALHMFSMFFSIASYEVILQPWLGTSP
jgi:hypothetical protein